MRFLIVVSSLPLSLSLSLSLSSFVSSSLVIVAWALVTSGEFRVGEGIAFRWRAVGFHPVRCGGTQQTTKHNAKIELWDWRKARGWLLEPFGERYVCSGMDRPGMTICGATECAHDRRRGKSHLCGFLLWAIPSPPPLPPSLSLSFSPRMRNLDLCIALRRISWALWVKLADSGTASARHSAAVNNGTRWHYRGRAGRQDSNPR